MSYDPKQNPPSDSSIDLAIRDLGREAFENTFANQYVIKALIGSGGMGYVFVGEEKLLRRPEALKVPKPKLMSTLLMERFRREASTLARLDHEGIVRIHKVEFSDANRLSYIAMEYISGEQLDKYLKRHSDNIRIKDMLALFTSVAKAIDYFHTRDVIHRDLKPANILIESDKMIPKIVDFGLARIEEEDINLTQDGSSAGFTLAYASPEQIKNEPVGTPTDIYSFTVTLYRCLCQEYPYDFSSNSSVILAHIAQSPVPINLRNPKLPKALNDALFPGLEKKPENRPQRAVDIVRSVTNALEPFWENRLSDFYETTAALSINQVITKSRPTDETISGTYAKPNALNPDDTEIIGQKTSTTSLAATQQPTIPRPISSTSTPTKTILQTTTATPTAAPPAKKVSTQQATIHPRKSNLLSKIVINLLILIIFLLGFGTTAVMYDYNSPTGPTWSRSILFYLTELKVKFSQNSNQANCNPTFDKIEEEITFPTFGGTKVLIVKSSHECGWKLQLIADEVKNQSTFYFSSKNGNNLNDKPVELIGAGRAIVNLVSLTNQSADVRTSTLVLYDDQNNLVSKTNIIQLGLETSSSTSLGEILLAAGSSFELPSSGGTAEIHLYNLEQSSLTIPSSVELLNSEQIDEQTVSLKLRFPENTQWENTDFEIFAGEKKVTFHQPAVPQWRVAGSPDIQQVGEHQLLQSPSSGGTWNVLLQFNSTKPEIPTNLPVWLILQRGAGDKHTIELEITVLPSLDATQPAEAAVAFLPNSTKRLIINRMAE